MRAIIKDSQNVSVRNVAAPPVINDDDVVISVALAGLCRTDVFVSEGRIPAPDGLILGHEFAGYVAKAGDAAHVRAGDRVTVMPVMPCRRCALCLAGKTAQCHHTTMLGIDFNGAFAEQIVVPARTVHAVPDKMSFRLAAYSEPVAAALSVLKSGIQAGERGIIYGNNRFGQLLYRILRAHGFDRLDIFDDAKEKDIPEDAYDFAVETLATTETMARLFQMLCPGGRVVIKSRKHEPVGINFAQAVRKELTLSAVNYGDFDESIRLMADGVIRVDDLLGEEYALEDFRRVFEQSKNHETSKVFFKPA